MDTIAIIDFGSQYAHLIANRVRRLGVFSEILLPENARPNLLGRYKGIILSGGPQSVYAKHAPTIDRGIFELGIPVLGLCYGHQLMAHLLGGKVEACNKKEYGLAKLEVIKKAGIFYGVQDYTQVWMSHGDTVTKLPPGFVHFGRTKDCKYAAMGNPMQKFFSTQFHMEVTHTTEGMRMVDNFLDLCEVKRQWSMEQFLAQKVEVLKRHLNGRKVFLLVSGGVDSTVAYALLAKALGSSHVYGLFVDTGFLRRNEGEKIAAALKKIGVANLHVFKAKDRFLRALKGVIQPEEKRKIIGDVFLEIQAEAVRRLKLNPSEWVLGQGTIYPDTIESAGTKHADKIKTHHNRVPEILELIKKGRIIEPLAELYKDEVRSLGEKLGLPPEIIWRHPFPGPGLAVRMLCSSGKGNFNGNIAAAEESIEKFLLPHGLNGKILPIQSVGVQGDARTYRHPLVISCHAEPVEASPKSHLDFDKLETISTTITNRFPAVNRVCLLLHPDKIHSVVLRPATLTSARIAVLQKLDDIVMRFIQKNKIAREIWQFPVIIAPVFINGKKREIVILRPVCSEEAMTANFYKMPRTLLKKLTSQLAAMASAVLFDVTNKPPGTIEWE